MDTFAHVNNRQRIAAICMVVSCIFTLIEVVYLYLMYKNRDNKILKSYVKARSRKLFTASIMINIYWSSIHPLITGIFFMFFSHKLFILITVYCYGFVMLMAVLSIDCMRSWILFFNFNYYALQFEKLWKSKLLESHYELSWFESHKQTFGKINFLSKISLFVSFSFCCIVIPYAYVSQLAAAWYFMSGIGVFLTLLLFGFLVLKLHSRHNLDNFGMRSEITIFLMVFMCVMIISMIFFFQIYDPWLRLYIINIPIHISSFFFVMYSFIHIINEIKRDKQLNGVRNSGKTLNPVPSLSVPTGSAHSTNDLADLKFYQLLQDPLLINEFARWMIGEFSLEHLLFIIEISQFRQQFISDEDDDEYDIDHTFKIASNVPLCATLIDYPQNYTKQAQIIIDTFISRSARLTVNVSAKSRKKILNADVEKMDNLQLKTLFDAPYHEVYMLLDLDSFMRFKNSSMAHQLQTYIKRHKTLNKIKMFSTSIHRKLSKENHEIEHSEVIPTLPPIQTELKIVYSEEMKEEEKKRMESKATLKTPSTATPTTSTLSPASPGDTPTMSTLTISSPTFTHPSDQSLTLPSRAPELILHPKRLSNPFESIAKFHNQQIDVNDSNEENNTEDEKIQSPKSNMHESIHSVLYHIAIHTNKCACKCHCA